MELFAFYSLSAVTLGAALGVVLLRNVLHSTLMLGLSLIGVAGLFAALGADFAFAGQILIYVTGIAVLILFVVMLSGRASDLHLRQMNKQWLAALMVCFTILWGMSRYIGAFRGIVPATPARPTTNAIGRALLGEYAVPFELISVVLVVALIGAILFATTEAREAGE